jgi:hypothetical protein
VKVTADRATARSALLKKGPFLGPVPLANGGKRKRKHAKVIAIHSQRAGESARKPAKLAEIDESPSKLLLYISGAKRHGLGNRWKWQVYEGTWIDNGAKGLCLMAF